MLEEIKELKKLAITKVNYQTTFMMVLIIYITPILIDYLNIFKHIQIEWVNQSLEVNEYHSLLSIILVFVIPFILNYWTKAYYLYVYRFEDYSLNANNFIRSLELKEWLTYLVKLFVIIIYILAHFLLLIVPGIIKICDLVFVPYILIEDKDLSIRETISKSTMMAKAHRKLIFWLLLSFIPGLCLSIVSFGLFAFFLVPYYHFTILELYNKYARL